MKGVVYHVFQVLLDIVRHICNFGFYLLEPPFIDCLYPRLNKQQELVQCELK